MLYKLNDEEVRQAEECARMVDSKNRDHKKIR